GGQLGYKGERTSRCPLFTVLNEASQFFLSSPHTCVWPRPEQPAPVTSSHAGVMLAQHSNRRSAAAWPS
ncbi:hypothetical protein HAX54_025799, partial [Datura stramonium]|nr:hypothetical protein [Datura stramonium]